MSRCATTHSCKRVVYEPVSIEPRTLVPRVIRHDNRYDPVLHDHPPGERAPVPGVPLPTLPGVNRA